MLNKKILNLFIIAGACVQALVATEAVAPAVAAAPEAAVVISANELAKQSEAKAAATAADGAPSIELIMQKVDEAAAMLEAEGMAGLRKLQGEDSEFIFNGTYIWVHDENTVMVMHPIKYKMNGMSLMSYSDTNGKFFFTRMTQLVDEQGQGWVSYMWPKPGEKMPSKKVSFVKGVEVDGKTLILGCGIYDVPEAKIKELTN